MKNHPLWISLSLLADWQRAGDSHFFKVILSPEQAHRVDLKAHVTNLMVVMQNDVNTALEWVAIDHHNTEHPHVHLLIRGIDAKGKSLTLDKQYISRGIRQRSQELLTRELGLRTSQDIVHSRAWQIDSLDRFIITS